MITLNRSRLSFHFPHLPPTASVSLNFQRTLRLPDNDKTHALPPGLGAFPLVAASDYVTADTPSTMNRADFAMPMYQSEAMWINFVTSISVDSAPQFDFLAAIVIEAGSVNAVSGGVAERELRAKPQNYVVVPEQPWLDGFAVEPGVIRQFVATPAGEGATIEEQLTGKADVGGVQIRVVPMRTDAFAARLDQAKAEHARWLAEREKLEREGFFRRSARYSLVDAALGGEMGLASGGRMHQEIYEDEHGVEAWDMSRALSAEVSILNSRVWKEITGNKPPYRPPSAEDYTRAGLPWFKLYDSDRVAVGGSNALASAKTLAKFKAEQGDTSLTDEPPIEGEVVKGIGTRKSKRNKS